MGTLFDQVGGGNKEINFMSGQLYGCQNIEHGKSLCKALTFQNSQAGIDLKKCKSDMHFFELQVETKKNLKLLDK